MKPEQARADIQRGRFSGRLSARPRPDRPHLGWRQGAERVAQTLKAGNILRRKTTAPSAWAAATRWPRVAADSPPYTSGGRDAGAGWVIHLSLVSTARPNSSLVTAAGQSSSPKDQLQTVLAPAQLLRSDEILYRWFASALPLILQRAVRWLFFRAVSMAANRGRVVMAVRQPG